MSNQSRDTEATPTQKAAEVAWKLQQGEEFTTAEIAEHFGMTWHGADRLLNTMSAKVPIIKENTRWRKM